MRYQYALTWRVVKDQDDSMKIALINDWYAHGQANTVEKTIGARKMLNDPILNEGEKI